METKFSFRQRGYQCENCAEKTMIFGQDPEPIVCPKCGQTRLKKEWDHLVTVQTTVEAFVAQQPAASS